MFCALCVEECEKKYVDLQKDVVRACGRKLQQRQNLYEQQLKESKLNQLPNYHRMDFTPEPNINVKLELNFLSQFLRPHVALHRKPDYFLDVSEN